MPQVAGATTLRIKAGGNAADTSEGLGAREVIIQGLDASGVEITDVLVTKGEDASTASTLSFIRCYRAWVSESGKYADQLGESHVGNIVIEDSGGSEDWLTISAVDYSRGQSQIACYTIPLGFRGVISKYVLSVDSARSADIILFQRPDILKSAAPYPALRAVREHVGVVGIMEFGVEVPLGVYPPLTDIGFLAKAASVASVSTDIEIGLMS